MYMSRGKTKQTKLYKAMKKCAKTKLFVFLESKNL